MNFFAALKARGHPGLISISVRDAFFSKIFKKIFPNLLTNKICGAIIPIKYVGYI